MRCTLTPTFLRTIPVALSILLFLQSTASSQVLEAGLTVGALFDRLSAKVNESIDKAIGGGVVLEIGAGGEVSLVIQQAKAAYANSLNLTISQLSAESQKSLNTINSMVQAYTDKTYQQASDLEDRGHGIVATLPGANNIPKLYRYEPRFIKGTVDPNAQDIDFTLHGDFVDVPEASYEPLLKIGGRVIKASAKSTTFLIFKLPASLFVPSANSVATQYITIDIPYKSGFIFHHENHTDFKIPVSTLPTQCGNISIVITTTKPAIARQQRESDEKNQDSSDDDIKDNGEHADLAIHRFAATAGWRIIPSSVHYNMIWSQGEEGNGKDWWFSRNISSLNEAVLCFSTEHHGRGTSGKIKFKIVFTEEKDILENATSTNDTAIQWGDRKAFEIPTGASWKGSYKSFDGTTADFNGAFSNKFINVTQNGSLVVITTIP